MGDTLDIHKDSIQDTYNKKVRQNTHDNVVGDINSDTYVDRGDYLTPVLGIELKIERFDRLTDLESTLFINNSFYINPFIR